MKGHKSTVYNVELQTECLRQAASYEHDRDAVCVCPDKRSEGWSERRWAETQFIIAKLFCQAEHTEETKL